MQNTIVHLDLFSGIGGFALAVDRVFNGGGITTKHVFCDNEPFAQAILKKHWPDAKIYGDIRTLKGKEIRESVDILTGGFPCQPFSSAGKRRGTEDDRHLWPEMLRVIRETAPRWIIGENVGGLVTWDGGMVLESVLSDLEAEGYEAWPFIIPACAIDAPHRRDRVWIIAHTKSNRDRRGSDGILSSKWRQDSRKGGKFGSSNKISHSSDTGRVSSENTKRERCNDRKTCEERTAFGKLGKSVSGNGIGFHSESDASHSFGDGARGTHGSAVGVCEPRREDENISEGHKVRSDPTDGNTPSGTIANTSSRRSGRHGTLGKQNRKETSRGRHSNSGWSEDWIEAAARLCTLDDGLPGGLARPRGWRNAALKGAGNAIVPGVAQKLLEVIKEIGV